MNGWVQSIIGLVVCFMIIRNNLSPYCIKVLKLLSNLSEFNILLLLYSYLTINSIFATFYLFLICIKKFLFPAIYLYFSTYYQLLLKLPLTTYSSKSFFHFFIYFFLLFILLFSLYFYFAFF